VEGARGGASTSAAVQLQEAPVGRGGVGGGGAVHGAGARGAAGRRGRPCGGGVAAAPRAVRGGAGGLAVLRAYPFRVAARGVLPLVRGARAGRPAGRRRQRRHGGRAPRRRGAVTGGWGGPNAMEGRGDRRRRPVDAPGVPAPLLLAQRHRAPLQMHLQVQVLVLLTAVPSVLSSGYSSDLSSMAGREREGSRFRNSKWLHRFLSCLRFVQLLIHPHVACIGRQKKDFVLGSFLLHFTLPLKSKCHIRRFKTDH
jgi:hypothetical protein